MAEICPSLTVNNPHDYRQYMERLASFTRRVHIDLADGSLTPNHLIPIGQVWWPGGIRADLHAMYRRPFDHLDLYLALKPQLVIVQAEAEGDYISFAQQLRRHGIEAGVALLPKTSVEQISPALDFIDHVLIFSGDLGSYGGQADLGLLAKAQQLKQLKPTLELSWDGGVNSQNAKALAEGGIDVLNVGSFIARSDEPAAAYMELQSLAGGH